MAAEHDDKPCRAPCPDRYVGAKSASLTSCPSSQPVELVRSYRSGIHENSHYGSLVILDRDGSVILQRGDVHRPVFHRSCAKPLQAIAMLELNAPLAGADLALAAASHTGEPEHVRRTLDMLARIRFHRARSRLPGRAAQRSGRAIGRSIRGDGGPRRAYMNCSGKHAAMLATCRIQDWSDGRTIWPSIIRSSNGSATVIETATGEVPAGVGVDGCGAPVYATSLVGLARGFGTLATAEAGSAGDWWPTPCGRTPSMVGGTGVDDTRLMQDGGRPAGQGRRGRRPLRRTARRTQRRPEDRRRQRSGADSGPGRRPELVWALAAVTTPVANCWTNSPPAPSWAADSPVGSLEIVPDLF